MSEDRDEGVRQRREGATSPKASKETAAAPKARAQSPRSPRAAPVHAAGAGGAPPNLMPFYMIALMGVVAAGNFIYGHVQQLRELEANWDPQPKGLGKDDVVILYCTS